MFKTGKAVILCTYRHANTFSCFKIIHCFSCACEYPLNQEYQPKERCKTCCQLRLVHIFIESKHALLAWMISCEDTLFGFVFKALGMSWKACQKRGFLSWFTAVTWPPGGWAVLVPGVSSAQGRLLLHGGVWCSWEINQGRKMGCRHCARSRALSPTLGPCTQTLLMCLLPQEPIGPRTPSA